MRAIWTFLALVCLTLALGLMGCGGSSDSTSTTFKGLRIEPANVVLPLEGVNQFTAVLDGSPQPVVWTVTDANGGLVSSGGNYKAPKKSGTYTVRVALRDDPTKFATATVVVDSGFKVTVTNVSPIRVALGSTITLNGSVAGTNNQGVTWTASAGTITVAGVFTPPTTLGDVNITATSIEDPGKSITFKVTVVPPVEIAGPNPAPLALAGSTITFGAKVGGLDSSAVTWTTTGGTIAADGTLTTPTTAGTVTVTATSTSDPSKSTTIDVQVVSNVNIRLKIKDKQDIVLGLRPDKAPGHCRNIVSLVNKKFYDGIIFHRYEPNFVIQGGDPLTKTLPLTDSRIGTGGPGYTIPFEPNDLLHTQYALAMARSTGLDTGGSQFYITLSPQPSLDGNYVVFGIVLSGFDVVDSLRRGDVIVSATTEPVATP